MEQKKVHVPKRYKTESTLLFYDLIPMTNVVMRNICESILQSYDIIKGRNERHLASFREKVNVLGEYDIAL